MSPRSADVDLRSSGEYLLISYSRAQSGVWQAEDTPQRLPSTATPEEIGVAAIRALARSRTHPRIPNSNDDSVFLKWVGEKTFAKYMRNVKKVNLRSENESIDVRIAPYHNGGWTEGFTGIEGREFTVPGTDATALGEAILRGLELATC